MDAIASSQAGRLCYVLSFLHTKALRYAPQFRYRSLSRPLTVLCRRSRCETRA